MWPFCLLNCLYSLFRVKVLFFILFFHNRRSFHFLSSPHSKMFTFANQSQMTGPNIPDESQKQPFYVIKTSNLGKYLQIKWGKSALKLLMTILWGRGSLCGDAHLLQLDEGRCKRPECPEGCWLARFEMVEMVNFTLSVFYHNKNIDNEIIFHTYYKILSFRDPWSYFYLTN